MTMVSRRTIVLGTFVVAAIPLSGCNDADEETEKVVATTKPTSLPAWLTVKDHIDPSVWLRSREVGHDVLPTDPEVDRIRHAMLQLTLRFYEDARMIANRTAQTGDILAEMQQPERYVDIMTGMVDVADVSICKKLYGEMCQHYLNLRKQGKDRTAALQQLMTDYRGQDAQR